MKPDHNRSSSVFFTSLALLMVGGLGATADGQGTVNMNTLQTGAYLKFYDQNINAFPIDPTGSWYHVALYWGIAPDRINSMVPGLAGFANALGGGLILSSSGGGTRTITDFGQPVTVPIWVQLRAWTGPYATYEQAMSSGGGNHPVAWGTPIVQVMPSQRAVDVPTGIPWGGTAAAPLIVYFPTPEPSTIALIGFGLAGMVFMQRCSRSSRSRSSKFALGVNPGRC